MSYLIFLSGVISLLYFVVAAAGIAVVTLLAGACIGGIFPFIARWLREDVHVQWLVALAAGATVAGTLLALALVGERVGLAPIGGVLLAVCATWIMKRVESGSDRDRDRCFRCKRVLGHDTGRVNCPRCAQVVCMDARCWRPHRLRCSRCDEQHIVLFPLEESWWLQHFGPRVRRAEERCFVCQRGAAQVALHRCGQCRYPSCRQHWDDRDGVCARCNWVAPGARQVLPHLAASAPRPMGPRLHRT